MKPKDFVGKIGKKRQTMLTSPLHDDECVVLEPR